MTSPVVPGSCARGFLVMRRRLSNIAAAVSLLLCVAIMTLTIRSYWRSDEFSWGVPVDRQAGSIHTFSALSGRGGVMLAVASLDFHPPPEPTVTNYWSGWVHRADRPQSPTAPTRIGTFDYSIDMLGFGMHRGRGTSRSVWTSDQKLTTMTTTQSGVLVPHWFVALVFAALPLLRTHQAIRLRRVRRRAEQGLCESCGYDLRGTPERCPECGAVRKPPPVAAAFPAACESRPSSR